MLQNLPAQIVHCYERARRAAERGDEAAEARWLALAQSYEFQARLSRFVRDVDRPPRKRAASLSRIVREHRAAFDPEALASMTAAYDTVLKELRLMDREDAATLLIGKCILELAAQGERDAKRLAEATLEALSR